MVPILLEKPDRAGGQPVRIRALVAPEHAVDGLPFVITDEAIAAGAVRVGTDWLPGEVARGEYRYNPEARWFERR